MLPLHQLVRSGNDMEGLRRLLRRGEDPNAVDDEDNNNTPLHIVASKERIDPQDIEDSVRMARVLIDFGADINKINRSSHTPFLLAVISKNRRLVEFFLDFEGLHIHTTDRNGNTALHLAITAPNNLFNLPPWDEYYATRKPVLEMVETLLKRDFDINASNGNDERPVLLAVKYQDFPVFKALLIKKPFVHYGDEWKYTAMYYALDRPSINLDLVIELFRNRGEFYNRNEMDAYFRRLTNATDVPELEKAKCVFKVFFLGRESLREHHERKIEEISNERDFPLYEDIKKWRKEIDEMKKDKLRDKLSVYFFAQRGFFVTCERIKDQLSDVFDALLLRLKNSMYPLYQDIIVCSITRKYLSKALGAVCDERRRTEIYFLNNDTSYIMSFYLSHLEILNCIIAFSFSIEDVTNLCYDLNISIE